MIEIPLEPIELKDTKLHTLLRNSTVWTASIWMQAVAVVEEQLDEDDVQGMHEFAFGGAAGSMRMEQALEEFYFWPPTVMLGAFDLIRGLNFLYGQKPGLQRRPSSSIVRQWAKKEGIPVPDQGRVPKRLFDEYLNRRLTSLDHPSAATT